MHYASCLCGAVKIEMTGELPAPTACHCSMCRKQSGHHWASVELPRDQLSVTGSDHVQWYQASEKVRRGFCKTCGSFLFFDALFRDWTAVSMGAFDTPTQTKLSLHIYTDDKGDYYNIADGVPQNGQ